MATPAAALAMCREMMGTRKASVLLYPSDQREPQCPDPVEAGGRPSYTLADQG